MPVEEVSAGSIRRQFLHLWCVKWLLCWSIFMASMNMNPCWPSGIIWNIWMILQNVCWQNGKNYWRKSMMSILSAERNWRKLHWMPNSRQENFLFYSMKLMKLIRQIWNRERMKLWKQTSKRCLMVEKSRKPLRSVRNCVPKEMKMRQIWSADPCGLYIWWHSLTHLWRHYPVSWKKWKISSAILTENCLVMHRNWTFQKKRFSRLRIDSIRSIIWRQNMAKRLNGFWKHGRKRKKNWISCSIMKNIVSNYRKI